MQVVSLTSMPILSAVAVRATRANVWDLLVVKPQGDLVLLTHGLREIQVQLRRPHEQPKLEKADMDLDISNPVDLEGHGVVVAAQDAHWGTTTVVYSDGWKSQVTFDICPQDKLVVECFQLLALTLPTEITFELHCLFLEKWSSLHWSTSQNVEFSCFSGALYQVLGFATEEIPKAADVWSLLATTTSHLRFSEDPVLKHLKTPPTIPVARPMHAALPPHPLLAPLLYGLHTLAEHLRLSISRQQDLLKFAPVVCRVAVAVRPEWADYWKRLVPDALSVWPSSITSRQFRPLSIWYLLTSTLVPDNLDDRIPVWPPDLSAILYGRVSTPDWKVPWHDVHHIVTRFSISPSFEYGVVDPLHELHELSLLYNSLSDGKVSECQKRAENVVYKMVTQHPGRELTSDLPLGIAAPLREAVRTCQLAPPGNWPLDAYRAIGRNDLAASATQNPDLLTTDGYKTRKEFIVSWNAIFSTISLTNLHRIHLNVAKRLAKSYPMLEH